MKNHIEDYKSKLDIPWGFPRRKSAGNRSTDFLRQQLKDNPLDIDALCAAASIMMAERRFLDAKKILRDFLHEHTDDCNEKDLARVATNFARMCEETDQKDVALEWYKKAVQWKCEYPHPYLACGRYALERNHHLDAMHMFNMACEKGDTAIAWYHKGLLSYHLKDYPSCAICMKLALEREDKPLYHQAIAACCIALNQTDDALNILKTQPKADSLLVPAMYYHLNYYKPYMIYSERNIRTVDPNLLAPYFYAAKQTNQWKRAEARYEQAKQFLVVTIQKISRGLQAEEKEAERAQSKEILRQCQLDLEALQKAFRNVSITGKKPPLPIQLPYDIPCGYIDCIRHTL